MLYKILIKQFYGGIMVNNSKWLFGENGKKAFDDGVYIND
jgi:hypothetical protein